MLRMSVLVVCLLLAWSEQSEAATTLEKIKQTQVLTIGARDNPPFAFVDEHKQVSGYAIELCQKIGEAIKKELKLPNLKLVYVPVDSATRFTALDEGKIDMECGSTTNNAERRKKYGFTLTHFIAGIRALVRSDSGIKNWNQFRNRTIVTTKSTTTLELLSKHNDIKSLNLKLVEGASDQESFNLIVAGKADVFPMDDVLLATLRAEASKPDEYMIIGEPLTVEPYSIMFRKNDPDFKKIVDLEMLRLINDGEIYKIYDRWFMRPIPPKGANLNMPMGRLLRGSLRFPSDQDGN